MSDRSWKSWRTWQSGTAIALGLSMGVLLGILLDNLGVWLALGVMFGALGEDAIRRNDSSR